jgi:Acetyltransferases
MENIIIRQFGLDDYDQAAHVWQQSGLDVRPGDDKTAIARKLERDPELFLVACDGGAVIGTAIGGYDGRRGYIYHLGVLPEYQRQGIGARLVAEVGKRLAALGCPKLNLSVSADNAAAIEFYKKLGFESRHLQMGKAL